MLLSRAAQRCSRRRPRQCGLQTHVGRVYNSQALPLLVLQHLINEKLLTVNLKTNSDRRLNINACKGTDSVTNTGILGPSKPIMHTHAPEYAIISRQDKVHRRWPIDVSDEHFRCFSAGAGSSSMMCAKLSDDWLPTSACTKTLQSISD